MTLEEAIEHAEEMAKEHEKCAEITTSPTVKDRICKCAEEHRQLAEWLRELKTLKAKKPKSGEWEEQIYDETLSYFTATCSQCGYSSSDPFVIEGSHLYCERCGAKMIFKYKGG